MEPELLTQKRSGSSIDLSDGWEFIRTKANARWLSKLDPPTGDSVDLPHCWNTTDTFQYDVVPYAGFGSYRKRFRLAPGTRRPGRWELCSEGFYGIGDVWLNGTCLGKVDGSYLGFRLDCTAQLLTTRENLLAIRLTNRCPRYVLPGHRSPDFILHGGLTGRVWLRARPRLGFDNRLVAVHSTLESSGKARVSVGFDLSSCSDMTGKGSVVWQVLDDRSEVLGESQEQRIDTNAAQGISNLRCEVELDSCTPWSVDQPVLYTARGLLRVQGGRTTATRIRFGIRHTEFRRQEGFFLNGEKVVLAGCNRHESLPGFGQAMPPKLNRQDALVLKELGCNFVRLSHYPQHPTFLDACDELGLLVYAELASWKSVRSGRWLVGAYRQFEELIRRDRNRPSIILWGMGNESRSRRAYTVLGKLARRLDPTRPVTYAENHLARARLNRVAGTPDVWGINYSIEDAELGCASARLGAAVVTECVVYCGAERGSDEGELQQVRTLVEDLRRIDEHDCLAGFAVWALTDYATMHMKRYRRYSGLLDAFRVPKYAALVLQARCAPQAFVRIRGEWGSRPHSESEEGETSQVRTIHVFSNCDRVRLLHNLKTIAEVGQGLYNACEVPYLGGELIAIGERDDGTSEDRLVAFGSPHALAVEPEQTRAPADPRAPIGVLIKVVDDEGVLVTAFSGQAKLSIAGPGRLNTYSPAPVVTLARGQGRTFLSSTARTGRVEVRCTCGSLRGSVGVEFV